MKTLLPISVIAAIILTSCLKGIICIDGNGNVQTESRNTPAFSMAVNTTQADVVWRKADSSSITVSAESNLLNHIKTIVDNGRLEIRTDPRNTCFNYSQKPVVTITSPGLNILELTGTGDFSADTLSGSAVDIKLTGTGDIFIRFISCTDLSAILSGSGDAEIRNALCENATFTLTGSGDLNIKGLGMNAIMNLTGSGDIESDEFQLLTSTQTITGSGNISTYVQNSLKAVISGSGNIYLRGDPVIDQTTSGSGRVIRR
jgi:hypothetical protein